MSILAIAVRRWQGGIVAAPEEHTLRYACLVYMDDGLIGRLSPREQEQLNVDSVAYDVDLKRTARLVHAEALQGPESATCVRIRAGKATTTDGPFAETKEHLGGFILVEARDLNDALRIAEGIPLARLGATIEVRPVFDIPLPEGTARP
jgi:hypothetical protein